MHSVHHARHSEPRMRRRSYHAAMAEETANVDNAQRVRKAAFLLGLFYLAIVVVLWVLSSAIIQTVLATFEKPFFITFMNSIVFIFYPPLFYLWENYILRWKEMACRKGKSSQKQCFNLSFIVNSSP